ncbi:hypothetical protein WICMUC_000723 [Wickerhamomyces mucosus]|uniref:Kinesin-like protein KIP1 n=1 Tax=Wickerhamomyces mucosus TaxID=1378264 RepID=A0A9P8PWX3_9ASCO|nr:hypothetical protein WICMUC_000723 [Wickerhamomyces mucosus]
MSDRRRISTLMVNSTNKRSSLVPNHQISKLVDHENKLSKRSSIATTTPSHRPKSSTTNYESTNNMEESNISVYVRCRSRNEREIRENSGVVVSTTGHMGKEVVLQTGPMSISNKTYTFDRVFGAESDQEIVYDGIANNILKEMLQGYNCTIFAYGQTGTGKTYTMSGDIEIGSSNARLSENAGIIPRTLRELFKKLEKTPDFSVKISFIELYNEELRDLLIPNGSEERKVKIFEDPTKKSIVVQGMEEIYIKNASEGMKILADGSYKRQVAATHCNDLSSRSHSVFTITVHMKEIDPISGEEYLKTGKLNLVDLAGSENINRSGAENKRAREAGMINQSLLTLGRVINALVDQSPHIPYRESKLTRLLQDSLGGKTKTCIIATISPAKVSLEETISTLEYANRAKSIKNKPQVNQAMSKKMLIKEYVQEIERLRNDLNATRNKNGIYITEENWEKITAESESRRILIEEQKLRMNLLEDQLKKSKKDFEQQINQFKEIESQLEFTQKENSSLSQNLIQTSSKLDQTEEKLRWEEFVTKDHLETENDINKVHELLLDLFNEISKAKEELYSSIEHKKKLESQNIENLNNSKLNLKDISINFLQTVNKHQSENIKLTSSITEKIDELTKYYNDRCVDKSSQLSDYSSKMEKNISTIISNFMDKSLNMGKEIDGLEILKEQIKTEILKELNSIKIQGHQITIDISNEVERLQKALTGKFDELKTEFKSISNVINLQINQQTTEITSLKSKLIEHERKHENELRGQTLKLENFKKVELERSRVSKKRLLQEISDLIDQEDNERNARIDQEIDNLSTGFTGIADNHAKFVKNFEHFIQETWHVNQMEFLKKSEEQFNQLLGNVSRIDTELNDKEISKISSTLKSFIANQDQFFQSTIVKLNIKLGELSSFTVNLKSINDEASNIISTEFSKISSNLKLSFTKVLQNFEKFNQSYQGFKPFIIENFIDQQTVLFNELVSQSENDLQTLDKCLDQLSYLEDEDKTIFQNEVEFNKPLPILKTHDEVFKIYKDQIQIKPQNLSLPADSNKENISPITPIPDKLTKINQDDERKLKKSKLTETTNNSGTLE